MQTQEFMEYISIKDLTGNTRELAECIGLDNLIRLSMNMGGSTIYILSCRSLALETLKRIIQTDTGATTKELADRYGVSIPTVRKYKNY